MENIECKSKAVSANSSSVLRLVLILGLTLFGVHSFSNESFAYPLSKTTTGSSNSNSDSSDASDDSGIKPTKAKKTNSFSKSVTAPMAPGTHNVSIAVGQVFLLGSLGNLYENSIGFDAHYTYGVSDLFAFQGNAGYSSHSMGIQSLSVTHLEAGLRTNLIYFDQLVPFFNVGLGFYHPSITYANSATLGTVLFGLQLGMGVDLFVTNSVFFGAQLTYNDMFDATKQDSNGANHQVGGSFVSFMIHAGISFY